MSQTAKKPPLLWHHVQIRPCPPPSPPSSRRSIKRQEGRGIEAVLNFLKVTEVTVAASMLGSLSGSYADMISTSATKGNTDIIHLILH